MEETSQNKIETAFFLFYCVLMEERRENAGLLKITRAKRIQQVGDREKRHQRKGEVEWKLFREKKEQPVRAFPIPPSTNETAKTMESYFQLHPAGKAQVTGSVRWFSFKCDHCLVVVEK